VLMRSIVVPALAGLVLLAVSGGEALAQRSAPPQPSRDTTGGRIVTEQGEVVDTSRFHYDTVQVDTVRIDGDTVEQPVEELSVETGPPWRLSYYPYVTGGSGEGPMLAARVRYSQPSEFEDRVTYRGALSVEGAAGLRGSRFLRAKFEAPLLRQGWRAMLMTQANRQTRFGFYGLGNDTEYDQTLEVEGQERYYDVTRTRYQLFGEVTRHLKGPFQAALLVGGELARFTEQEGLTLFETTMGPGVKQNDLTARLALLYDTRNNEFNPSSGMLAEVGVQGGTGGDGYQRVYGVARGYLPIASLTMIAARIGASSLSGTPTLNARYELPTWNETLSLYGGYDTNRGYRSGRFVGEDALFGNLEVRHDAFAVGELAFLTVLGFVDVGRVFEGESLSLDTDDLHWGAGGGLAIRLLRSTVFAGNVAKGSDGWRISLSSGWAF
jgi:hypothetical protein